MKKNYVYLLSLGHLLNDSAQSVLPALLPLFITTYHLSYEQAGLLILANTALSSILQPALGYFSDRLSLPRLISLGVLLSGCSIASMGFLHTYGGLFTAATLAGVGSAIFHPEGAKLANKLGGTKQGKSMGTFAVGGSAGFALGPVLAGLCAYQVGPHGLIIFAVTGISAALMFYIFIPKVVAHINTNNDGAELPKKGVLSAPPVENLQNDWPSFSKLTIVILTRSITFAVLNAFIPIYWITVLGQSPEAGGFALTILFTIGIFVTYIGGVMSDRYGYAKVMRYSFLIWVPSLFFLINTTNIYIATLLLIPFGIARTLVYSPVIVLGQTYLAKSIGFASGITLGVGITFGGIIVPLIGRLADMYGVQEALQVLPPVALVALVTSFFLSDNNNKMLKKVQ